jgi:transcriptional regulator
MYIPAANRVEDPQRIRAFIRAHGFATIVSMRGESPWASHLPMLLDTIPSGDRLRCHMARANEQWQHFESGAEILCIFPGPHAYVSPSWYEAKVAVPTWNYATVHVYGVPQLETDPAFVRQVLDDTTSKYESSMPLPWTINFTEETYAAYAKAIVTFSVRVTRMEAKFKLGQNRSAADQAGMLSGLEGTGDPDSHALARFIREQGSAQPPKISEPRPGMTQA